jgi:DNA replication protein DnaC
MLRRNVASGPLARPDREATLADGILDRLVHNAHRIEMRGDSIRKLKGVKEEK